MAVKVSFASVISGDFFTKGIISNGKMLLFLHDGTYKGESVSIHDASSVTEVDLVSLLHYNNTTEIGLNVGRGFMKKDTKSHLSELMGYFSSLGGFVFGCRRRGIVDGQNYSQYLYVFTKGVLRLGDLP